MFFCVYPRVSTRNRRVSQGTRCRRHRAWRHFAVAAARQDLARWYVWERKWFGKEIKLPILPSKNMVAIYSNGLGQPLFFEHWTVSENRWLSTNESGVYHWTIVCNLPQVIVWKVWLISGWDWYKTNAKRRDHVLHGQNIHLTLGIRTECLYIYICVLMDDHPPIIVGKIRFIMKRM